MSQTRVAYHDIPTDAVITIATVIKTDEGGFQFNGEANDDWNFAGVLAENIQEYLNSNVGLIDVYHTDTTVSLHHWLESLALEQQKTLIVEIYYNKYWLPLSHGLASKVVYAHEFSCAVNCGVGTALALLSQQKDFLKAWRNHYVKLVVDNAQAWHDYATDSYGQGKLKPATFRAPNLAGWLARVDRYA